MHIQSHGGTQLQAHTCLTRATPTSRHTCLRTDWQAHACPSPQAHVFVSRPKETHMFRAPEVRYTPTDLCTRAQSHRGTHVCLFRHVHRAPQLDKDSQEPAYSAPQLSLTHALPCTRMLGAAHLCPHRPTEGHSCTCTSIKCITRTCSEAPAYFRHS